LRFARVAHVSATPELGRGGDKLAGALLRIAGEVRRRQLQHQPPPAIRLGLADPQRRSRLLAQPLGCKIEARTSRSPSMSTTGELTVRVEACAGHLGEAIPCRFFLGPRQVDVAEVVDRWLGSDRRYFKVRGDDGDFYILRHEPLDDRWELTLFATAASLLAIG
jgi:hypothetical protein